MSRKKGRRSKRTPIERDCFFCPHKGYVEGHHLIPQDLMGDWVPYGIIEVCKSCHNIIDDLTRSYIYRPTDDKGEYVVDAWERTCMHAEDLKKRSKELPDTISPFDKKWLLIYNYFMEEVVPLWEAHKKKTIEQIVGLDEGGTIEVIPADPLVREIKHWWELPLSVLENYVDSGLGDPRKAKWKVVIEKGKTYYRVEPRES